MKFNEIIQLFTMVTSLGMSHWIRSMLVHVWVPGWIAVIVGCAVSVYTHRWFWLDVVEINRPDKHAWVWIAAHPVYLFCGLCYEYDAWKKRRAKARDEAG